MRLAAIASALAIILCAAVFGAIFLQRTSVSGPTAPALAAPGEGQAPAIGASARADAMKAAVVEQTEAPTVVAQAAPAPAATTCSNPNALGIARTVEIDTTGGPGFGFEHFKSHDFLREGEVVLTFDDGPWPKNTPARARRPRRALYQGDLLPDRASCHLRARHPQAGCGGRPRRWFAHLVPPGFVEDQGQVPHQREDPSLRIRSQGRDREGHQRGALGRRRADRTVLPLPGPAAAAGADRLSRQAQHRHLLDRPRLLRLQDAQARAGPAVGYGQVEEARQRHCSSSRFPACHR